MEKFTWVLVGFLAFSLSCAKGETPKISFNRLQQAGCSSNWDEFLSRVDFESLTVSLYKEGKSQVTEDEINKYKASEQYKKDIDKIKESFKKTVIIKNNDLCNLSMVSDNINGDTAYVNVQEGKDDPYNVFKWGFKKTKGLWVWTSVDGFQNEHISISAEELHKEYEANIIAADNKYKKKIITVTGVINKIGKDITGRVYVTLGNGILGDVQCIIRASHVEKVANLKAGDKLSVTGLGDGKTIIPQIKESVF